MLAAASPSQTVPPREQLLREAAKLDSEQKCEEAERYYRQALAMGPPTGSLLNNFGNHYVACGDSTSARQWFEKLLTANPGHQNANLQLARIETEERHGTKALAHLARVTDSSSAVRLLKAEALYWAGRKTEASAALAGIQKEADNDAALSFQLGLVSARTGDYQRAESAFNQVLAGHPGDYDVLFNLGRAAARAGHHERATQALETALKIRPEDPDAMAELGLVQAVQQDYSRAVYMLARASARAPRRPDILLALARAAGNAGFYGDAALAYDRYLELTPSDDTARRDRALSWGLGRRRLPEALTELEAYARTHPNDPIGHYNMAQLLWKDDPEKAIERLSAALRADARFTPALLGRGWQLYREGRPADALGDLQAARALDGQNVRVLAQLGLVFLALDRPGDAEGILRHALTLAPSDPDVLLHLGRCLIALGKNEEGQRYLAAFQKVRPPSVRGPREEAGMIELATLSPSQRIQRAIPRLREDARTHPGDLELQFQLASLLLRTGQTADASAEFHDLLTKGVDAELCRRAGNLLVAGGEYSLAREFLARAAPVNPKARLDLALAVYLSGEPAEALKTLDEVSPEDRGGNYLLLKARMLDSMGRRPEARQALDAGLLMPITQPEVAQGIAILLFRQDRTAEAIDLLTRCRKAAPYNSDLLLLRGALLGVSGKQGAAAAAIKEIQARWPEWDRTYLVHGLLLERTADRLEAKQKLLTAKALGSTDPALSCALSRLDVTAGPDMTCRCHTGLADWIAGACPN